jgi:hypothetical protein
MSGSQIYGDFLVWTQSFDGHLIRCIENLRTGDQFLEPSEATAKFLGFESMEELFLNDIALDEILGFLRQNNRCFPFKTLDELLTPKSDHENFK